MIKIINYFYRPTNYEAKFLMYAVYNQQNDKLCMICPCKDTIAKLVPELNQDYYLAKVWDDGINN